MIVRIVSATLVAASLFAAPAIAVYAKTGPQVLAAKSFATAVRGS